MTQAVPFAGHLGLEITKVGRREATVRLPERQEPLASLDADGRVVFPCEFDLTDSDGQRIATATAEWHVRLNQPAAGAVK